MSVVIDSIVACGDTDCVGQCRLAFVPVPITVFELQVLREVTESLRPGEVLVLDTLQHLEDTRPPLTVEAVSEFTGVESEVMRGLLADFVRRGLIRQTKQGLAVSEGVRRSGLAIVRTEEVDETVVAIGVPAWPVRDASITEADFSRINSYSGSENEALIGSARLDEWRRQFWGPATLALKRDARVRLETRHYAASGELRGDCLRLTLADNKRTLSLDLALDHPWVDGVATHVSSAIEQLPRLLAPYGVFDPNTWTIHVEHSGWMAWKTKGGGVRSRLIVKETSLGLAVEVVVESMPRSAACASAMMNELIVEMIGRTHGDLDERLVATLFEELRAKPPWNVSDEKPPSLAVLEELAWDVQQWSLAYRLAASKDGL